MSFEDQDRTLTHRRAPDSERLYNSGSRATSGYGSGDVGGLRANGVGWKTPRGRGGCRVQFSEERSGPNEESEDSGKEIDRTDDWCRSPRRGLTLRYSESPDSRRSGSRVGRRIRPDDLRGTSNKEMVWLDSRSTLGRRESDRAE